MCVCVCVCVCVVHRHTCELTLRAVCIDTSSELVPPPTADLPDQLLNQLLSMQTEDKEEQLPREMTSDLSTLPPEDQQRLEVVDDTIQQ